MTQSQLSHSKHIYCQMSLENLHSELDLGINFFEPSQIRSRTLINNDKIFPELKEYSIKFQGLYGFNESIDQIAIMNHQQICEQTTEDRIYNVLQFKRGYSQFLDLQQGNNQRQIVNIPAMIQSNLNLENSKCQKSQIYNQEESLQQSYFLHKEKIYKQKSIEKIEKKITTKNVTKNMGKLLFKWIWSNRQSLEIKLKPQFQIWSTFISNIKIWKSQNNITRHFLNQRWHGKTEECRLFRLISSHFFRRECLSAICGSNIENKPMHINRLKKYLQGVSDPTALDSLN